MSRLAVSALCWERDGDLGQLSGWRAMGVQGVEAVPGRMLPSWPLLVEREAMAAREAVEREGLGLPAMQAILFGKQAARLFEQPHAFAAAVMEAGALASMLGIPSMVWGAPGSRRRGALGAHEAMVAAASVLRPLCDRLHGEYGVRLLVEHNPPDYGCDFVTSPAEAVLLAEAVGSVGFGFHLDVGGLEDVGEAIALLGRAGHLHASQRGLGPFEPSATHAAMAMAMAGEDGAWASLEMLPPRGGEKVREAAIRAFVDCYGGHG